MKEVDAQVDAMPRKLEVGQYFEGGRRDIWVYDRVPEGMRPAAGSDIFTGRSVLYRVELGPDLGKYYTAVVTRGNIRLLRARAESGGEIFVKK